MPFNRYISTAECAVLAELFREEGESVSYARDTCFSEQGLRCRDIGLVEKGAFRYVHGTPGGDRHIVGYSFTGEFVGDYASICSETPSMIRIEAMCTSSVLRLSADSLQRFYARDAAHERLGRRIAERLMAEVYERLLTNYATTPRQRYEELLGRCPELFRLVPLHELASFLGIRPETLSRTRREVK